MAVCKYSTYTVYTICACFFIRFVSPQPQKGKIGTKGQKQIVEENEATLKFYRYMIGAVSAVYIVLNLIFGDVLSLTSIVRIIILFFYHNLIH